MSECWNHASSSRQPIASASRSPSCGPKRDPRHAGASPKANAAARAAVVANASTRQSSVRRAAPIASGTSCSRNRMAGTASTSPATAPSPARTRHSVRNWAISLPRPAPRATRTATSRLRTSPRDNSRFARLAQAINSNAAQAHIRTINAAWVLPAISSRRGIIVTECEPRKSLAVTCKLSAAMDCLACSNVIPGLRRATMWALCQVKFPRKPGGNDAGIHMSMSREGMK